MIKIEELAAELIKKIKAKKQIALLLRNSTFLLQIKTENKAYIFEFKQGEIKYHSFDRMDRPDVIIYGAEESVCAIIAGKKKLRDAIRESTIKVHSTFRKVLLLESLFLLCKN